MNIGPFRIDSHADVVRATLATDLPWWTLYTISRGHVEVTVKPVLHPQFWPVGSITISAGQMGRWFAHEAGHALDRATFGYDRGDLLATYEAESRWRGLVRDVFGVPADQPWTVNRDVKHQDATGECFADFVAYECGATNKTSWGPHDWSDPETRHELKGILMEAADEIDLFPDVGPDHTHRDGIHWAAGQGLVQGFKNGKFSPSSPVTRGQLATILRNHHATHHGGDDA